MPECPFSLKIKFSIQGRPETLLLKVNSHQICPRNNFLMVSRSSSLSSQIIWNLWALFFLQCHLPSSWMQPPALSSSGSAWLLSPLCLTYQTFPYISFWLHWSVIVHLEDKRAVMPATCYSLSVALFKCILSSIHKWGMFYIQERLRSNWLTRFK